MMLIYLYLASYVCHSVLASSYKVCVNDTVSMDVWETLRSTDRHVWASATCLSRPPLVLAEIVANEPIVPVEHDIPLLVLLGGKKSPDGSFLELEFSPGAATDAALNETCNALFLQEITQTEHKLEVFKAKHANAMNSYKQAYYKGKRRIPVNILKKMPGIPC